MALCLTQVFNKDRTFRPRKRFEPGTQRFELYKKAQASLKSGLDLRRVVQLPEAENINDWIAVHVVDFFNRINLIYGTMSEFCTERSCPIMSGGLRYEYRWQDDLKYKKPTKVSAPLYMNLLMDWIETLINNEDIFPTQTGIPFPKNFQQVCTKILTRLFRVFVHVYIHHFDGIISVGAEAHVNTCYKHFYYFIAEFSLVDHRELEPLSGHLVCSNCRPKLTCCPTCRGPLGSIRNLAMEKVANSVLFLPHLMHQHKSITTLQGEDIVFLATDINLPGAVDWVMMQSCFGFHFMLVLEKQEKYDGHQQFFAIVQLIGTRKQAENFAYRLELNGHRRRLTWEATPRSIHEGIATAIINSDCLVFDTSIAQLFAENGNLGINVTISMC